MKFLDHGSNIYNKTAGTGGAEGMKSRAIANQWVGRWDGKWEIGEYSGRFALVISAVTDTTVVGEAYWFDTAALMPNEPLINARIESDVLIAEQPCGLKIRVEHPADQAISGTWKFNRYKGTLQAQRKTD